MCSVTIAMTNAPLRFDATDRVVLRREGMILDEVAWTAAPPSGVSLTRSPDRTGPFAFHATTTDSQGVMRRLSPGCKTDSTPF